MTYRLKFEARNFEGVPGVPWRDLTDEEFAAASAQIDAQFPDQPGALARWFDYVKDKKTKGGED